MRLVDADKIVEESANILIWLMKRQELGIGTTPGELHDKWLDTVRKMPTAYDLDKVMKQLEEKTELAYRRYMDCPSYSPCSVRYQTQYIERKMCLEIVKGGGADEKEN